MELIEPEWLHELQERVDAGDNEAAKQLTSLLAAQNRISELRSEADAGTYGADGATVMTSSPPERAASPWPAKEQRCAASPTRNADQHLLLERHGS